MTYCLKGTKPPPERMLLCCHWFIGVLLNNLLIKIQQFSLQNCRSFVSVLMCWPCSLRCCVCWWPGILVRHRIWTGTVVTKVGPKTAKDWTPSRVQARALCFLSLFGVLGARPTHPVRLQAYTATQAERWRGQPFPWSPSFRHGNKLLQTRLKTKDWTRWFNWMLLSEI